MSKYNEFGLDKVSAHYVESRRFEMSSKTIANDIGTTQKNVNGYIEYLNKMADKKSKTEIKTVKDAKLVTTHMIKATQKGRKGVCIMTENASTISDATRTKSKGSQKFIHKCDGSAES